MATCKQCDKSGLFLKVSSNGLCKDCESSNINDSKMIKPVILNDWKKSRPHLDLLSRFLNGNSLDNFISDKNYTPVWKEVLKESPKIAFNRFISEEYLIKANLSDTIGFNFRVMDLKGFCKERGLTISGKKSDLIDRLVNADDSGMKSLVKFSKIYSCSETGKKIARDYLDFRKEEEIVAEEKMVEALKKRDFKTATQIMIDYEKNQVFPRGMGIDWSQEEVENYLPILSMIFNDTPKILKDIPKEKLEPIRLLAGRNYLLGKSTKNSLNELEQVSRKFNNDTCARMLLFYAINRKNLADFRNNPSIITGVKILTNDDSCEECKKFENIKYRLSSNIPELPHPKCKHEYGCRCDYIAMTILDKF